MISAVLRPRSITAIASAVLLLTDLSRSSAATSPDVAPEAIRALAREVHDQGWIAFSAPTGQGTWDIHLMRPDGSSRRPLTATPDANEFWPQFSRDGSRILYRRLPRQERVNGNRYGLQGRAVVADSDGANARELGGDGEFPWATWAPDGTSFVTLSPKAISFVDAASGTILRILPRQGFFQQITCSPDGRWLVGVANNFASGWSIARMEIATGKVNAVNTVDCCTPDWFPDSREVIFSWRPPGQDTNKGNGWTQIWRAEAIGRNPRLVYAKDDRHGYGSFVSPDAKYLLLTGNIEEDGDPGHGGGPMSLIRLADAPIIEGSSPGVRARHPEAHNGPVLPLPDGWEPSWTFSEHPADARAGNTAPPPLAPELRRHGWIAFSFQTERGDWDLAAMRPDGSERRALTSTPEFNEAGVRFSPDGRRLLYYRMAKSEAVDNNTYGTFDLVIADASGAHPTVLGRGFPWASWGPDSRQLATLTPKGVQIVDVETRAVVRTLPRHGIVQQLIWSPDGKAFTGTANGLGPFWNIAALPEVGGAIRAVSETERYNCTPDWCPDGRRIVYARGIIPEQPGRAELWVADTEGRHRAMVYAETERHVYGACSSPDGRYLLFTRSVADLGAVGKSQTTLAIIRWSDTPMRGDDDAELRGRHPDAQPARRLDLGPGWEPHWTLADLPPLP